MFKANFMGSTFLEIEAKAWDKLELGAQKSDHPFHTMVVSTTSAQGSRIRTVVLRKAYKEKKEIHFYTDVRSQKWNDLSQNPNSQALFYDPDLRIQLVLGGKWNLLSVGNVWEDSWKSISLKGRKSYMTPLAPGTSIAEKGTGLHPKWEREEPSYADTELNKKNFGLLIFQIQVLEYLELGLHGNYRAIMEYEADNSYSGQWIIP